MGKHYKGDNNGGYGNPPVKGQFKKGGAPGPGRPKGSNSMGRALRKVFGSKLDYTENGRPVNSDATVALAKRALGLGLTGPASANARALDLAEKFGPQDDSADQPVLNLDDFTYEEIVQFEMFLCRALGVPHAPIPSQSDHFEYLKRQPQQKGRDESAL